MSEELISKDFEYDVCLSFAGEQRDYVEKVAEELRGYGIRVFFDDYELVELWGKDLYSHLDEIYQNLCRYCILFSSKEYSQKIWTSHERRSAQARALKEKKEYILPARFDDTPIPGLPDTIHYIDLKQTSPSELVKLASQKLGTSIRKNYLPPVLDRLYERLEIQNIDEAKDVVESISWSFFEALRRMDDEERNVVLTFLRHGCPDDLPDNIHINSDLLRRLTGYSVTKLKQLLGGLRSLGFECILRKATEQEEIAHGESLGETYMFEMDWVNYGSADNPTILVAYEMVLGATEGYCEEHGNEFLDRLDFSQLASATATEEVHE